MITGREFADVVRVHKYLFTGIYVWAGQFRQVDMTKGSTHFLEASFLYQAVEDEQRRLDAFGVVTPQDEVAVASKLGDAISALNFMHPFREGNGRTQRIIAAAMAATKGYRLDIRASTAAYHEYFDASIADNPQAMAAVFARHLIRIK